MISEGLLAWYDANARALPWRSPPGAPPPEPYRVWLSEIMLQQTTVAAVKPYFARFLARWSNVEALAAAEDAEVMRAWAGLGYYSRARNLLAAARLVVAEHGGRFPGTAEALRTLPGVGDYTAAAIASIAFGERATVVDGNVERVVARLFAADDRKAVRSHAEALTPADRPGDHAQAMMDLGATICTPRRPDCAACPVAAACRARAEDRVDAFPVKPAKPVKPTRRGYAYWLECSGEVLLVTRPAKGLLGGMRALPASDFQDAPDLLAAAPAQADWRLLVPPVVHVFTHFALELHVAVARTDRRSAGGLWWPVDRLAEAGLPTLFDKAARRAMESGMLLPDLLDAA